MVGSDAAEKSFKVFKTVGEGAKAPPHCSPVPYLEMNAYALLLILHCHEDVILCELPHTHNTAKYTVLKIGTPNFKVCRFIEQVSKHADSPRRS